MVSSPQAGGCPLASWLSSAPLRFSDRRDIVRIVELAKKKGFGMKWILHSVVASEAFRRK